MQTSLSIESRGGAAIVFQSLATADFRGIVRDMEEVVRATAGDSGTTVETTEDDYGFSWLVLKGEGFDDLVVGINAVSTAIDDGGYGERLLCACSCSPTTAAPALPDLQLQARRVLPVRPGAGDQRLTTNANSCSSAARLRAADRAELWRWFALRGIPI